MINLAFFGGTLRPLERIFIKNQVLGALMKESLSLSKHGGRMYQDYLVVSVIVGVTFLVSLL